MAGKVGRPALPADVVRGDIVKMRVTKAQKERVKAAAAELGMTISDFMLMAMQMAVDDLLKQ